jgi:hypothetical protein
MCARPGAVRRPDELLWRLALDRPPRVSPLISFVVSLRGGSKHSASTQRALRVGSVLHERNSAITVDPDLFAWSYVWVWYVLGACGGESDFWV